MSKGTLSRREFLKLLALATLAESGLPAGLKTASRLSHPQQAVNLPNILILVFDTFSANHISLYGYRRETTPNLARFASRANVYHRHYAGGNFTLPGTASLLTGVYPWSHRGLHLFGSVREDYVNQNLFSAFAEDYFISTYTQNALAMGLFNQFQAHIDQLTPPKDLALISEPLADRLFAGDYYASFWGERVVRGSGRELPTSLFLSYTGLGRDFHSKTPPALMDQYGDLFPRGLPNHSVGLFFLLEDAIDWIKSRVVESPRPFLGYFHLLPPHEPYCTRREFVDYFNDGWKPLPKPILRFSQRQSQAYLEKQRRFYDEYIAYADAEFGRLYGALESSGALDDTILILTSDHGQLFERGIHGHLSSTLYDPLIHIPLLISLPGQTQRHDIGVPTSCVDVLPTLLHLAGKPVPDWCEGQVLPGFSSSATETERSIFSVEAKSNPKSGPLKTGTIMMVKGRYKIIHYFGYKGQRDVDEIYDLVNDPSEREDRQGQDAIPAASDLKAELIEKLSHANQL